MTWFLRSNSDGLDPLVERLAAEASGRRRASNAHASDHDPRVRLIMSCVTFGMILLTGQVQDITGIE
jgi:hypothetical protein